MRTKYDPIGRLLKKANNQISREFDKFAAKFELTGQQMLIIDFLYNNNTQDIIQNQVEYEFNIRRSATTAILQRMEKNGLIDRCQGSKDARQKVLKLTEKVIKLVPDIKAFIQHHDDSILSGLTEDEAVLIQSFLTGIINHQGGNEKNE